jgi:hypothetical protein
MVFAIDMSLLFASWNCLETLCLQLQDILVWTAYNMLHWTTAGVSACFQQLPCVPWLVSSVVLRSNSGTDISMMMFSVYLAAFRSDNCSDFLLSAVSFWHVQLTSTPLLCSCDACWGVDVAMPVGV